MATSGEAGERRLHRRAGAVIMSGLALVWALVGASGLPTGGVLVSIVAVGVTAIVLVTAFWDESSGGYDGPVTPDWRRRCKLIGLTELVTVVAVVVVANLLDRAELIPGGVCLVVAGHFLPLAHVFGVPRFRRVAVVLAAVGLVGLALSLPAAETGRAVVGLGAALALWWASLPPLARDRRAS